MPLIQFNDPQYIQDLALFVNQLDVKTIMEVGSHSGEILAALELTGHEVHGLEEDANAALKTTKLMAQIGAVGRSEYIKGGLLAYKSQKKWDLTISSGLVEHYDDENAVKFISKMAQHSTKYVLNIAPYSGCIPYKRAKAVSTQPWRTEKDYTPEQLRPYIKRQG